MESQEIDAVLSGKAAWPWTGFRSLKPEVEGMAAHGIRNNVGYFKFMIVISLFHSENKNIMYIEPTQCVCKWEGHMLI